MIDYTDEIARIIWQWNAEVAARFGQDHPAPYNALIEPTKDDLRELARRLSHVASGDKPVAYVCDTDGCSERLRGLSLEPLFCSVCMEDLTPVYRGAIAPSDGELTVALGHLAGMLNAADFGSPAAEAFLRKYGWEWCEKFRPPAELAALPVCVRCGERWDPEGFRTGFCTEGLKLSAGSSSYGVHQAPGERLVCAYCKQPIFETAIGGDCPACGHDDVIGTLEKVTVDA